MGYAKAIGIETALNQADGYPFGRHNKASNYSPLVVLEDVTKVDEATADISGCVRTHFAGDDLRPFVRDLTDVIGDLHDNVWSHGESTGISMAQKWNKPYSNGEIQCVEFGLADCGRGFLGELRRSGVSRRLGITTDRSAIEWCIQEGHSSKLPEVEDPWAQRLPPDMMGNPIGASGKVVVKENHHQGLGLHKLTTLVLRYGGELWLVSGDSLLQIDGEGQFSYIQIAAPWTGVALACRFATDKVKNGAATLVEPDELDRVLLHLVEGSSDED